MTSTARLKREGRAGGGRVRREDGGSQLLSRGPVSIFPLHHPPPPLTRVKASHPESTTLAVIQQSEGRCNNSVCSGVIGLSLWSKSNASISTKFPLLSCGEIQYVCLPFYVILLKRLEQTVPSTLGCFSLHFISFGWTALAIYL